MALDMCSNSSSYEPSSLVTAFHSIPHIDINLNQNVTEFENTLDYYETIIIWACVPILAVLCIFILMSVYFICICCCCCCQQHEERSKCSKASCGILVTVMILLGLACCGVALWAEFSLNSEVNSSTQAALNANSVIQDTSNMARELNFSVVNQNVMMLSQTVMNTPNDAPNRDAAVNAVNSITSQQQEVQDAFEEIQRNAEVQDFEPTVSTIDNIELIRHWTVVAYVILTAVILFVMAISVCCGALCGNPICMAIALLTLGIYTFTMWVAVGGNLGYLIIAGDICNDPDRLIMEQLDTVLSENQVQYYIVCNETCYTNPFVEYQDDATEALEIIMMDQGVIMQFAGNVTEGDPDRGMEITNALDAVVANFDSAASTIDNITMLTDCTGLNMEYLQALDGLCGDGYMFSLILFAMACALAVTLIMILGFGSFYAGLLSKGRTFDDETIVYDFPNDDGPSPWQSYGTQQQRYHNTQPQYNFNNSESFNMATTAQTEPPKYTDLHQESQMNGNMQPRASGHFDS